HKHPQGCFFVSAAGKPLPKTGTAIAAPSPVCFMSSVTAPEPQFINVFLYFPVSLRRSTDNAWTNECTAKSHLLNPLI
ncbi:TPA: hypothetical protein ACNV0U_001903, partial [Klebsiella variicola]